MSDDPFGIGILFKALYALLGVAAAVIVGLVALVVFLLVTR